MLPYLLSHGSRLLYDPVHPILSRWLTLPTRATLTEVNAMLTDHSKPVNIGPNTPNPDAVWFPLRYPVQITQAVAATHMGTRDWCLVIRLTALPVAAMFDLAQVRDAKPGKLPVYSASVHGMTAMLTNHAYAAMLPPLSPFPRPRTNAVDPEAVLAGLTYEALPQPVVLRSEDQQRVLPHLQHPIYNDDPAYPTHYEPPFLTATTTAWVYPDPETPFPASTQITLSGRLPMSAHMSARMAERAGVPKPTRVTSDVTSDVTSPRNATDWMVGAPDLLAAPFMTLDPLVNLHLIAAMFPRIAAELRRVYMMAAVPKGVTYNDSTFNPEAYGCMPGPSANHVVCHAYPDYEANFATLQRGARHGEQPIDSERTQVERAADLAYRLRLPEVGETLRNKYRQLRTGTQEARDIVQTAVKQNLAWRANGSWVAAYLMAHMKPGWQTGREGVPLFPMTTIHRIAEAERAYSFAVTRAFRTHPLAVIPQTLPIIHNEAMEYATLPLDSRPSHFQLNL